MALPEGMTFKSFAAPALHLMMDGTLVVVPGWIPVPPGTTLKEVQERWTWDVSTAPREDKPTHLISERILSSKGDTDYLVTFDGLWWSCECIGFGCRKKCRHVDEVKKKHNIKA